VNPGDLIHDRFVVERFVARGGMGEVFRALDQHTQKYVAIKLLASEDEKLAERFDVEARALLELDHPAIVRYVAHGHAPGAGLYLAMEWLAGATLAQRLRRGPPLALDESLKLGARIADGLGAAHAQGMVHRDVKPGNLFLVGRRVDGAKILDFGLVRNPWQPITADGAGMGTPDYMAPEQARCEKNVGPPADVFALGCVLYRCIAGHPPFQGEHVNAILAKIAMLERPPRLADAVPDVPPAVDELVATLMAHDPALRPADGLAAAEAIREVRTRVGSAERTRRAPDSPALTTSEQRPVAVLFVELERPRRARFIPLELQRDGHDATLPVFGDAAITAMVMPSLRPDEDPAVALVRQTVEPVGGRVVPLLNGALVVMLSGGAAAPELAARAARCALAIRAVAPGASISLATRNLVVDDYRAASPMIDGAAALGRSHRIRIDKRTRELLPEHFDVVGDDAEGLSLVGERAPPAAPRRLLGREVPMVGRQAVLRQLQAAWAGALEEHAAHALVVVGEAGVGKSRLRAELVRAVGGSAEPATIVLAAGDALRSGVPGGLVARALRAHLGLGDGALALQQASLRARVAARLPEEERERVSEFLGQIAGVPLPAGESVALRAAHQDPQLMAEQKRRAFADWLAAECRARPVLFVVDDLHWADPVSVDLLAAGLRRARDLPLLVLAFGRPELGSSFPRLDADWGRQELRLDPLRPQACEQLARHALGDDAAPGLLHQLVERSGGNPFYLEELIRAAASPEPQSLPPSLLASTQLRIGRRPPRARQVLRAASVFGRVFWPGGLAALLGGEMERAEIDEWLARLERDELIEARPGTAASGPEYAFRHDLLRDATYQMLTPEDRAIGHRLAGAWLVERGEADAVVLAEHFAGGGVTRQAVDFFERAAERALAGAAADVEALGKAATYYGRAGETCAAAYANADAIAYLERAAALWAPLDQGAAARTRLELARVRERAGERERALEDLRAAEDAAVAASARPELRVEILLARAWLEMRGGEGALERARKTAEEALELARSARLIELEARALAGLAATLVPLESPESTRRAVELAQRAVDLSDDRGAIAASLWRLGNAFLFGNDLGRAREIYEHALAAAEESRDELVGAHCMTNLGMVAFRRFDLGEAIELTERAQARYERIGHRTRALETTLNLGMFHHLRGDGGLGRELLERVLAGARGDWILTSLSEEQLADAARAAGHESRAQAYLADAARLCEQVGVPKKQALYLGLRAESLWASGDAAQAIATLEQAARAAKALTLSHAILLLHLGPLDDAEEWLERFGQAETDPHRRWAAQLGRARAQAWTGRAPDALRLADEILAEMGPAPVARFVLPVRCFRHALAGETNAALDALALAQGACAPFEFAEATVDVGAKLIAGDAARAELERYVAISDAAVGPSSHQGVRHRLEDLRAEVLHRLGDGERARDCLTRAHDALDRLFTLLPAEYGERLDEHPWTPALRRVRVVP
jgi:predicted ATPase